jgi:hypothetical protein
VALDPPGGLVPAGGFDFVVRPIVGNGGFIQGETLTVAVAGSGSATTLIDLTPDAVVVPAVTAPAVITALETAISNGTVGTAAPAPAPAPAGTTTGGTTTGGTTTGGTTTGGTTTGGTTTGGTTTGGTTTGGTTTGGTTTGNAPVNLNAPVDPLEPAVPTESFTELVTGNVLIEDRRPDRDRFDVLVTDVPFGVLSNDNGGIINGVVPADFVVMVDGITAEFLDANDNVIAIATDFEAEFQAADLVTLAYSIRDANQLALLSGVSKIRVSQTDPGTLSLVELATVELATVLP